MIYEIFNVIFGLVAIGLSFRYEPGLLNYILGINYLALLLFGIEVIRINIGILYNLHYSDSNYINILTFNLLILTLYNNVIIFMKDTRLSIIGWRLIVLIVIVLVVFINELNDQINEICLIILFLLNASMIILLRIIHHDEFKYGTIHQRYAYTSCLFYLIISVELLLQYFDYKKEIKLYYLFLPLAFNYDFQLNLFYKAIKWSYSTFIRSGTFSRLLLIIDYYEIPDTKI